MNRDLIVEAIQGNRKLKDKRILSESTKYYMCPKCHNKTLVEIDPYEDLFVCDECGAELKGTLMYDMSYRFDDIDMDEDVDDDSIPTYVRDDDYEDEEDNDPMKWRYVASKRVMDFDGFYTDYTWYLRFVYDPDRNKFDQQHVFIFGDNDIYDPENSEPDWEEDDMHTAQEWFDNYTGFEDDFDESLKEDSSQKYFALIEYIPDGGEKVFKLQKPHGVETKDFPYYVTEYSEYPIYEPAEGGYYYAGRDAISSTGFNDKKEAEEYAKQLVDEYSDYEEYQPIKYNDEITGYKTYSKYIGEENYIAIEPNKTYLSQISGRQPYESLQQPFRRD